MLHPRNNDREQYLDARGVGIECITKRGRWFPLRSNSTGALSVRLGSSCHANFLQPPPPRSGDRSRIGGGQGGAQQLLRGCNIFRMTFPNVTNFVLYHDQYF